MNGNSPDDKLKIFHQYSTEELKEHLKSVIGASFRASEKRVSKTGKIGQHAKSRTQLLGEVYALYGRTLPPTFQHIPIPRAAVASTSAAVASTSAGDVRNLMSNMLKNLDIIDRGQQQITYNDTRYKVKALQEIRNRYGLPLLKNAARKLEELKAAYPPPGVSGWATDVTNLTEKYFVARNEGGGHNSVSRAEMQDAALKAQTTLGVSTVANAELGRKALLQSKLGWSGSGESYTLQELDGGRIRRVPRQEFERLRQRLEHMHPYKRRPSDELVAQAYAAGTVGVYDTRKNVAIVEGLHVPGENFARFFSKIRASNDNSSDNTDTDMLSNYEVTELDDIYAKIMGPKMIEASKGMEAGRLAADAKILPTNALFTPVKLGDVIERAMHTKGPLNERPLLFGNFGKANEVTLTIVEQMQRQRKGAEKQGCPDEKKQRKPWTFMGIPMGMSLTPAQAVILAVTTLRARNVLVDAPGMLAWHSLGSGKTLATMCAIAGFWNTKWCIVPVSVRSNSSSNNLQKLASLASEFLPTFRSTYPDIPEYPFAHGKAEALVNLRARLQRGRSMVYGETKPLDDRNLVGSFASVAHDFYGTPKRKFHRPYLNVTPTVKNTLFIVDEAHMLFSPPSSEKALASDYIMFEKLLTERRDPKSTYVLALTATPGESVQQVQRLIGMVAGKDVPLENIGATVKKYGLVSFVYLSADRSTFAKAIVSKECCDVRQAPNYAKYYKAQLGKLEETQRNVYNSRLLPPRLNADGNPKPLKPLAAAASKIIYDPASKNNFWNRVRRVSEYIEVSKEAQSLEDYEDDEEDNDVTTAVADNYEDLKTIGMEGNPLATGVITARRQLTSDEKKGIKERRVRNLMRASNVKNASLLWKADTYDVRAPHYRYSVFLVSPKLVRCVQNILDKPDEIHFVYTNSWQSVRLLAFMLERAGYAKYVRGAIHPQKRYGVINKHDTITRKEFSLGNDTWKFPGKTTQRDVNALLGYKISHEYHGGLLQDIKNSQGQYCQVVLATGDNYKGVDVAHIRHVHCISMFADFIDLMQLQGRGPRNCSHRGLTLGKRTCTFHMYTLTGEFSKGNPWPEKLQPDVYLMKHASKRARDLLTLDKILQDNAIDHGVFGHWNEERVKLMDALRGDCVKPKKNPQPKKNNPPRPIKRPMDVRRLDAYKRIHRKDPTKITQAAINDLAQRIRNKPTRKNNPPPRPIKRPLDVRRLDAYKRIHHKDPTKITQAAINDLAQRIRNKRQRTN
jgi:hypothetical protein